MDSAPPDPLYIWEILWSGSWPELSVWPPLEEGMAKILRGNYWRKDVESNAEPLNSGSTPPPSKPPWRLVHTCIVIRRKAFLNQSCTNGNKRWPGPGGSRTQDVGLRKCESVHLTTSPQGYGCMWGYGSRSVDKYRSTGNVQRNGMRVEA